MRVVFLSTSGIENASPRGRWFPIARELAKRGHEPRLVLLHPTFDRLNARQKKFDRDGVSVEHVAQMHVYGVPGERKFFSATQLLAVTFRATVALARAAIRIRPDAIHICKPQPMNSLAALFASKRLGCKLYLDCDDYEAEANRFGGAWQRVLVKAWEDAMPKRVSGVTVNTRFLFERCATLGVPRERIAYVPNGVTIEQTQRPEQATIDALREELGLVGLPVACYVGTMSETAHGVGLLLDAFARVVRELPTARLLMVGDGDDRIELERKAATLGIDKNLIWVGQVPHEQTRVYLCASNVSVDPVYDTPVMQARAPMKVVESLALGVPVVTGEVGDRREMVLENGVVVEPDSAIAFAIGMSRALKSSNSNVLSETRKMSMLDAQYRWEILIDRWLSNY
jgi:glycosyltransferase involved in cell wall biosynthesis